ncbi:MAG TPA: carboxypeptidase regulatory-like domain-containing protein [Vicinamibacterales bacterium]|nr:carboxypeptidase regulatory-like domain-containing protein [Vicinamibacterales bacterium]
MTRRLVAIGGVALAVVVAAAAARTAPLQTRPQTPPRRDAVTAPPPTASLVGTGAIGGVVTNDDGSKPVRFAYIVLIGTGTGVVKFSSSDADGKFLFGALPADRYTIGASRPPYLGTVAGARRPGRMGTAIALTDGQKIANLAIRMSLGAVITGTIVDDKGQPAPNVSVGAYQMRLQNGERVPVAVGTRVMTDERGRYRLFGLVPGDYMVAVAQTSVTPIAPPALSDADVDAALRAGNAAASPPITQTPLRYLPVFFPGSPRAADAAVLSLGSGEERANVDVRLTLTRGASVSGTVIGADGQLPPRLAVTISPRGPSIVNTVLSAPTQPDGSFQIFNQMPGSYFVRAAGGGPPAGGGPAMQQLAVATIEVNGADVTGVQLVMRPGATIRGSVAFRGSSPKPALAGWRFPARTYGPSTLTVPTVQPADETGTFGMVVFPGTYLIGWQPAFGPTTDAITWSLESVVVDGRDVTDLPVEIGDPAPQNLVATFTDRYQELTGRITSAAGAPMSQYTIVVFPEDKTYWISGSRRILTSRPGTDGKFVLSGAGPTNLPAGRYLIAAVTDIDRDEQYDPAFLSALVPAAVPVTLQPGAKKVQDLIVR